jgi:SPP1 family predicted phage head-tail adaptor
MKAGILRNYVTIQQLTEGRDANLELTENWTTFAYAWAAILPQTGREYWNAKQVFPEVTGVLKIRYITGVTSKMRVYDGSKTYDIQAVIDVENRHKELVLLVKENP